jgi:hypothetical protein
MRPRRRCIDGHERTIIDHNAYLALWAIQYQDDSLEDPGIKVSAGDEHVNSDQARELAAALLEAAAELDRPGRAMKASIGDVSARELIDELVRRLGASEVCRLPEAGIDGSAPAGRRFDRCFR